MVREVLYRQKEMERKDGNFDIIGPVMVGLSRTLTTQGQRELVLAKRNLLGRRCERQGSSTLWDPFLQPGKGMERIRHLWQDSWNES